MNKSHIHALLSAAALLTVGGFIVSHSIPKNNSYPDLDSSQLDIAYDFDREGCFNDNDRYKLLFDVMQRTKSRNPNDLANAHLPFYPLYQQRAGFGCWIQAIRGILCSFEKTKGMIQSDDVAFYQFLRQNYNDVLQLPYSIDMEHEDTIANILNQLGVHSSLYNILLHDNSKEADEFANFIESKLGNNSHPIAVHVNYHWILITGINQNKVSIYDSLLPDETGCNFIIERSDLCKFISSRILPCSDECGICYPVNILVPTEENIEFKPTTINLETEGITVGELTKRANESSDELIHVEYYASYDRSKYFIICANGTKKEFSSVDEIQALTYNDLNNMNS